MQRLQFADFDVGQVIGSGTVGTVYEVVERSTNNVYALKLLLRNVGTDQLVVSRFEREILILSKLEHPNIVGMCIGPRQRVPFVCADPRMWTVGLIRRGCVSPRRVSPRLAQLRQ